MQPTNNQATDTTVATLPSVAEVLDAAGVYVSRFGMHTPTSALDNYDWSRDASHPAASDVGAIALVIYGEPVQVPVPDGSRRFRLFRRAVNAWVDWLEEEQVFELRDSLGLSTGLCKAAELWRRYHQNDRFTALAMAEPDPVPVPTLTVAVTLRNAATYLDRYGWIQGFYYDLAATVFTPAACLVGAIGMVCYGGPVDAPAQHVDAPAFGDFEAATTFLNRHIKDRTGIADCYQFNDYPGRTATEVVTALRDAADAWDQLHVRCPECGDPALSRPPSDWDLPVESPMPNYSHEDGTPLCPFYGPTGVVPAEPVLIERGA